MAFSPPPEMIHRLEETVKKHELLTVQLSQAEVIADRQKFQTLSKEHSNLDTLVTEYKEFKEKFNNYLDSHEMLKTEKDSEILEMAKAEISELEPWLESKVSGLQVLLLPKDPRDEKNAILELRQGVGGDEAGIFVSDMYRAYTRFAEKQGWRVELMSVSENSAGGYKEVVAMITGDDVFSKMKYESGVHRVQRVPKTEAQGRVHTSTITVAVLPEADEVELEIEDKELRIDVMRASGAGGQHVNKTDSAVRITHLPTGEVVYCQDEKSQHKNKAKAMKILRSRLLDKLIQEQHDKEAADRRSQVGTGFRNERIRTYNFPQGRVTDHRINMTAHNIDEVMNGDFIALIRALSDHDQMEKLKSSLGTA